MLVVLSRVLRFEGPCTLLFRFGTGIFNSNPPAELMQVKKVNLMEREVGNEMISSFFVLEQ